MRLLLFGEFNAKLKIAELKNFMISIGIMQGRLTPRGSKSIQFFPFDNWQNEFYDAAKIGIDEIEFIFDFDHFEENPLWSEKGRKEILSLKKKTGVDVKTICADFFMARPFSRVSDNIKKENVEILRKLIGCAKEIGARGIEIPLVDNSSVKTREEENILLGTLVEVLRDAKKENIWIGLETDLAPVPFRALLDRAASALIRANYDTGNSSGLGYSHKEELNAYGPYIANIHIKDRVFGGSTVPLGTGNAKFSEFFESLGKLGYRGSFILQVARGEDGKEKEAVSKQKEFVLGYINKYL